MVEDKTLMFFVTTVAIVGIVAVMGAQMTGFAVFGRGQAGQNGRWAGDWCKMTTPQGTEIYVPCQVAESMPEQAAPAVCGDGVCERELEDARSCPQDCFGPICFCDRTPRCDTGCRCDPDCLIVIGP